jgi:hypothetical protein
MTCASLTNVSYCNIADGCELGSGNMTSHRRYNDDTANRQFFNMNNVPVQILQDTDNHLLGAFLIECKKPR